jgi:hypothetical protein
LPRSQPPQAGALIVLHLLPTGYDPRLDAVSDYGIGSYRGWFWARALAGAVACLALAVALADAKPSMPTVAIVLLVIAGLARFLIRLSDRSERQPVSDRARHDPHGPGDRDLRRDHRRRVKARLDARTQASVARRQGLAHSPPVRDDRRGGWHLVALRGPRLRRIVGLFERLLYVCSLAWLLIVSIEFAHIGQ